jgi:DNA-binding NarL/FixJ family response regulator
MPGIDPARPNAPGANQLTEPERKVARLVAEGRTNPGVARALDLSPRELERHLSRIYRKLGVRTRRDLEAALAGLAEPVPAGAPTEEV